MKDGLFGESELLVDESGKELVSWKQVRKFSAAEAARQFSSEVDECSTALDTELFKSLHPAAYEASRVPSYRQLTLLKAGKALLLEDTQR